MCVGLLRGQSFVCDYIKGTSTTACRLVPLLKPQSTGCVVLIKGTVYCVYGFIKGTVCVWLY